MDAERLRIAEAAAAMAGEEALRAFRTDIGAVRTKRGPHDVVTETDERVERLVVMNAVPFLPGYRWHRAARVWRTRGVGELLMGAANRPTLKPALREARADHGPMPVSYTHLTLPTTSPV